MKKLLPTLLACILLLSGCQTAEGFLNTPASPSADLPERPGFVSEAFSQSGNDESSAQSEVEYPERNMTFAETGTPHLYRIITRKGDLEIIDMTYGDSTYFALTRRESGNSVTGYDPDGIGVFAGVLDERFTFPLLLGFADGYACLYSAEMERTFACDPNGKYVWYDYRSADTVALYRGGYLMVDGSSVSLYGPQYKKPYTTYTIPDGMTFVAGDEEQALASRADGTLVQLHFSADAIDQTELSGFLAYDNNALTLNADGQTVLFNPHDRTLVASVGHVRMLAAGDGYLIEEREHDIRLIDTASKRVCTLDKNGKFRFGGRTDDGFLFAQGGVWYVLRDEAFDTQLSVQTVTEDAPLLFAAGKALCEASTEERHIAENGAPFTSSDQTGYSATRVTDGETLFSAAAYVSEAANTALLPDHLCVYLCDSVFAGDSVVPYALYKEGKTTCILLDVTDPHYRTQLTEILTMLTEGIQG